MESNRIPSRIRLIAPATAIPPAPAPWEERIKHLPAAHHIRILTPPEPNSMLAFLWIQDMTLTEWVRKIEQCELDVSSNPVASALRPADYNTRLRAIFETNQRARWLARIVQQRWTQRVWRKRTQCNIDMIDMKPIADKDAIFLTDTKHRTIFRFHRNDVFANLLSNICSSDEMLPTPRPPTNPWTNSPLTEAQTMGLCQQLASDYGRRGRCPPVLFAAFWAARFSLKRFQEENSSLLSQHAVVAYFKDLHEHNMSVVLETIMNLLTGAGLDYSTTAIRRWLAQTPATPLHKEWLEMARDYTLYINLHVQIRTSWHSEDRIYSDVRRLYARTTIEPPSQRITALRNLTTAIPGVPPVPPMFGLMGLPLILHPYYDSSGNDMTSDLAIQLIQNALFR